MTNSKYPPKGIHPALWTKIKAKRNRELKAEVRALYGVNPVLWAVVKGAQTDDDLGDKFPTWSDERVAAALHRAIDKGYVRSWGGRYLPVLDRHKVLRRRLLAR